MMKPWSVVLVAILSLACAQADAKRIGGGKPMGRQSANVTQREAAAPAATPAMPANQAAPANATKAPAQTAAPAPAAQPAPRKPWGAMLGGLAAGLGLAWLAHSLGLGAAFGQFLLVALLALVAFAVIGMLMRARRPSASSAAGGGAPFAFQGASAGGMPAAATPRQYSPDKVGNDASARPWERSSMAFEAPPQQPSGVVIGSALTGPQSWGIPDGFDTAGFLGAAKRNFITLQDAWDRADVPTLRSMMTDDMLREICAQLSEREEQRGGQPNKTEVVMLEAQLLGIEDLGHGYMASVEFSGMIREEPSVGPSPFREVWNMTKPKDGSTGWLVGGVQALQ